MQALRDCPQDPLWHAEGDVWTHTLMVLEALKDCPRYAAATRREKALLQLSALLHDIAKPECTLTDEQGRIVSPRHAKIGEMLCRRLFWDADFEFREQLCALVRLHGLPLWTLHKSNPNAAVLSAAERIPADLLHALARADVLGRICRDQAELLERTDFFEALCSENRCWGQPYPFANEHSRFQYFFKNENYPIERFDDTRFTVVVLSGLPGSGKDRYAETLDMPAVSLDQIRNRLRIAPTDAKGQGTVLQVAYEQAKMYCRNKQSFLWNSTNLSRELRSKLVSTLSVYHPRFEIVYIETSWDNILRRRQEHIPLPALEKMWRILEIPLPNEAHSVSYRRN